MVSTEYSLKTTKIEPTPPAIQGRMIEALVGLFKDLVELSDGVEDVITDPIRVQICSEVDGLLLGWLFHKKSSW